MKYRLMFFLGMISFACRPSATEDAVLARVGDDIITAEEFRLNYEFGYGPLRRAADSKRTYLQYMLFEKAIARKAQAMQLDTLAAVRHAMHTLREELLIEQVFQTRVLDRIEVTPEEIAAEINKSAVNVQFRFIPAAGEQDARQLFEAVQARGYDAVLAERQAEVPELSVYADRLTSPVTPAEELDPELLAILKDLEINTPSPPVLYQGNWYVMEVTDIRRQRLADVDYEQKAPTYRKILYNRKAMEHGAAFVAGIMEPLHVVTRRAGFEILNEALLAWYREDAPIRNLLDYIDEQGLDTPYTRRLADHYEEPLVGYEGAEWRIHDFLEHFTPGRYIIRPDDREAFKARLADVVALVVRDAVLLEMADADGLEETPAFRRSMQQWKEKWLFQEYAKMLERGRMPSEQALLAFYQAGTRNVGAPVIPFEQLSGEQRERLVARWHLDERRRVADSLLATERLWIDDTMLDTLSVSVSVKNPYLTVNLLKSNSNKMAFPVVDPNWRSPQPSGRSNTSTTE